MGDESVLAGQGITHIAFFPDDSDIEGYTKIKTNINSKGTARYLGYTRAANKPSIVNLVFYLKWKEDPGAYLFYKQDLNEGAGPIPLYLATTTNSTEGNNAITDLAVVKASEAAPPGFKKIELNLNIGVQGGENLNLAYKS
ncbi:hypothetical protein [Saccharopolyspora taberi]|uniref:MABP domain-containing protein n=1 Tax=Saccharopolyspora taberi TaxID=60895 RepID=A0ABN3VH91_9PSEU